MKVHLHWNSLVLANVLVLALSAPALMANKLRTYPANWSPKANCGSCHKAEVESQTSKTKTLCSIHKQVGLGCLDCHEQAVLEKAHVKGTAAPKTGRENAKAFCLKCHSLDKIKDSGTEMLVEGLPMKPHDHWHYSALQMDCTVCHKAHAASDNICYDCHQETTSHDGWATHKQALWDKK